MREITLKTQTDRFRKSLSILEVVDDKTHYGAGTKKYAYKIYPISSSTFQVQHMHLGSKTFFKKEIAGATGSSHFKRYTRTVAVYGGRFFVVLSLHEIRFEIRAK